MGLYFAMFVLILFLFFTHSLVALVVLSNLLAALELGNLIMFCFIELKTFPTISWKLKLKPNSMAFVCICCTAMLCKDDLFTAIRQLISQSKTALHKITTALFAWSSKRDLEPSTVAPLVPNAR